jgi:hypothetical protein
MSWPFESWQQIAIRRFGIQPSEFWAMPLRDWLALMEGVRVRGFSRSDFDALSQIYPDEGVIDDTNE